MRCAFQKRRGSFRALVTTAALGIGLAVPALADADGAPAATNSAPAERPASDSAPAGDFLPAERGPAAGAVPVEEIVVTAQRQEERLQDVPISISVYSQ